MPLFAHGFDAHSSVSNSMKIDNYFVCLAILLLINIPWLHVGPIKPGSHWQVKELNEFGIQVPCLLHTSDVHTRLIKPKRKHQ